MFSKKIIASIPVSLLAASGLVFAAGCGDTEEGSDVVEPTVPTADFASETTGTLVPLTINADGTVTGAGLTNAKFVTSMDEAGSSLTLTASAGEVCVNGSTAQVIDEMWSVFWGSTLVMNLNNTVDADGNDVGMPFDADAAGIIGFAYTIEGNAPPENMRAQFKIGGAAAPANGNPFCTPLLGLADTVDFTDVFFECWGDDMGVPFASSSVQSFEFQQVANPNELWTYDYCVTSISAITQ